jgi:hypothetical protein
MNRTPVNEVNRRTGITEAISGDVARIAGQAVADAVAKAQADKAQSQANGEADFDAAVKRIVNAKTSTGHPDPTPLRQLLDGCLTIEHPQWKTNAGADAVHLTDIIRTE